MMMSCTIESYIKAIQKDHKICCHYCRQETTVEKNAVWNGGRDFLFKVTGMSDSEYAKDNSKKSVSGWSTFMNRAATSFRRKLMPIIALSVTYAELFSVVMCAQDMLFIMKTLNSMGFKVDLPMKLDIDNKGAKYITHNWSVVRRFRHVEVKRFFLG